MPQTFCVLLYHHSHGVDVFVTRTPDDVHHLTTKLILDWIDDMRDQSIRAQVLHLISEGRDQDACDLYCEHTNESFEYQHYPVLEALDAGDLKALAAEKISTLIAEAVEPQEDAADPPVSWEEN